MYIPNVPFPSHPPSFPFLPWGQVGWGGGADGGSCREPNIARVSIMLVTIVIVSNGKKQHHHRQQQRRHRDSTLGSLGSHSAFHVLERCSKGTRWGFIIADLPTLLRCHSLGSHMLGFQRVRCGANTAWVSSSLGAPLLGCGCHAGRRGTRWGMT